MAKAGVFCKGCGHTKTQHSLVDGHDEGCWNTKCIEQDEDGCKAFVVGGQAVKPKPAVDRQVAPVGISHPERAHLAAAVARLRSGTRRKEVYDLIRNTGHRGLTDDEMERLTGRAHQSLSATRNTLMNDDLIVDSGQRRQTQYHNPAIVWVVAGLLPAEQTANS